MNFENRRVFHPVRPRPRARVVRFHRLPGYRLAFGDDDDGRRSTRVDGPSFCACKTKKTPRTRPLSRLEP
jgi:hypothetical protein